jgi:ribulose-phosphate 3-epimerase
MPLTERHVAPSILSADFADLAARVRELMDAGARVIHCDVMDGHFVPPITFGPGVVLALREALPDDAYLDVHLMIERPERHVEEFAKAGADGITIHAEATPHLDYTLSAIREAGCKAGLVVCPGTPPDVFAEVDVDLALIMTVNPGWGGQQFLRNQLDKIRRVRAMLGDGIPIEVDGGVNAATAVECAEAGATWFVAGSAIFGSDDPAATFREIAEAAGCAFDRQAGPG